MTQKSFFKIIFPLDRKMYKKNLKDKCKIDKNSLENLNIKTFNNL
jgi:hypothetical protein